MRVFLVSGMDEHELPVGETILGRSFDCQLRFNHSSVSRKHLRIVVTQDGVTVEDLGSSNGSYVNATRIGTSIALRDGDNLVIGKRKLSVRILEGDVGDAVDTDTIPMRGSSVETPRFVTCDACRETMPLEAQNCPACGRSRRRGVHSRTQLIKLPQKLEQGRRHTRFPTDLLVFYASETLSFEAKVRDLSVSGVFVITELLDLPETPCKLTLLPDGYPAIELRGIVRRMEHEYKGEDSVGMGVEFISLQHEDRMILTNLLMRSQNKRRLGS
jgi:pSer/pThr/pTyr-binding forkhead associated (FHA) protein